jgi:hypothetical protein
MSPAQKVAPDTLPANFNGWDQAPDTLSANFTGWDASRQPATTGRAGFDAMMAEIIRRGLPRPQLDMQQSALGTLWGGPTGSGPDQTLPSPKAQMARDTTPSPAAGGVALAAGALTLAGLGEAEAAPFVRPAIKGAADFVNKYGLTTAVVVHLARELGVPLPKVLDVLGKFKGE